MGGLGSGYAPRVVIGPIRPRKIGPRKTAPPREPKKIDGRKKWATGETTPLLSLNPVDWELRLERVSSGLASTVTVVRELLLNWVGALTQSTNSRDHPKLA